jgi:hypothetical protein
MPRPAPVLPRSMPTSFPGHGRAGNGSSVRSDDNASQSFLDIDAQCRVEHELRLLRATSGSLRVPLCRGRTIGQAPTSSGSVAAQLPRDRRCRPTQLTSNLLHGTTLHTKKRDLLPLPQREISPRERLRRESKHRWWHAACLPEPSCSDSLRYPGLNRSLLAYQACRDCRPEPSPLITCRHRRSTR